MSVLEIREVGDPILNQVCEEINIEKMDDELLAIIEDMKETLIASGGYGIAAPQVGINKRIAIIKVEKENCRYQDCEEVPMTVMINPTWKKKSEKTYTEFEGCLSVPSIRGKVERYYAIEVSYYSETGEKIVKEVSGFTARDIQHECDHLDGIVFLEKVKKTKDFSTKENIQTYHLTEE